MERILRFLVPLTTVVLALALGVNQLSFRQYKESMEFIVRLASTKKKAEDWIGKEFPEHVLRILPSQEKPTHRLVWVISSDRCEACASVSANMVALDRSETVDLALVVVGSSNKGGLVAGLSRQLDSEVVSVGEDLLATTFGYDFKSLKLLVQPNGTVVSVDDRPPGGTCQWSFEGQLAALIDPDTELPLKNVPLVKPTGSETLMPPQLDDS